MYQYGSDSLRCISTCHPDLQVIAYRAAQHRNCSALSGRRGEQEQNYLYRIGASTKKYPYSDHNTEPWSNALDLVPYRDTVPHIKWEDRDTFMEFGGYAKAIADELGTPVGHGYDWDMDLDFGDQTFMDGAHLWLINPRVVTNDMIAYANSLFDYDNELMVSNASN